MVPEKWVAKNLASHGSWQPIEILRGSQASQSQVRGERWHAPTGHWNYFACGTRALEKRSA